MASGVTDSSLKFHLQNAKAHGTTQKEIAAVITHVAFYAGWPKGWAVFNMAKEVWAPGEGDLPYEDDAMRAHAKEGNSAIKAYDWANANESEFTANDKVAVSGGAFSSKVPESCCAENYKPVKNADGTYTVKAVTYVAEYNGTKYETLQAAIDAASQKNGGQTEVTLLCNLTITETIVFAKKYSAGSVLLNLGGYTLSGEGCRAIQINKGNLYLENGTVTSTGIINSSSVIRIGSNEDAYSGVSPMLYMRNSAKVLAPASYGVTIFGSKTVSEKLTVAGNASIEATGPSPAISGNGGKDYHVDGKGTVITITGNAVVSAANNYAIYHPDNGTVNIQDSATVSGKGGIQMCSGTLKISGSPTIEAIGKADHETGAAGPIYDVAAISVVNRSYPGGAPAVTIKGTPTITAVDGEDIHAYTWSNNAESEWAEAAEYINVSGGTYSKAFNEAFLTADSSLVANADGYTVELKKVAEYNGTQYTSLAQAVLDANNSESGGTVKLLDNVTLTNSLGIGGANAVTLNLNKKTLTLDGAQIYTQGSATVTINNGTIKRTDVPTAGSASNFAIQVMSGSSLILGAGTGSTYKVTLESTYGIYNVGGTLNVRYATITTDGWSIAVSDSVSKTGEVYIGRGMGSNLKTVITSESGNVLGTMVNSKPNVTINCGTLTSNGTNWDAGVIYWASEGTLTITGGIFNASSAEGSTAAAVYQKNGTVKISGTTTKLLGNNALVVESGDGSTGTMVTELSAGTYSTKPDEVWVVEGKEIHETNDGLYKVEGPYVVEVILEDGTVHKFDSWSKAFYSTEAQEHNATVKLLNNIETTSKVTTWATVTIDFNGYTLNVNSSGVAAITALTKGTAANVTLKDSVGGGGMVTTGLYGVTVKGTGAIATVESGNYNCDTSVVQVENGTAYIKGGTFQTEDTNKSYLLNCIDEAFKAGTAKIEVIGGTFYGFDPSASPEGEGTTYVADNYKSVAKDDGTYTVAEIVLRVVVKSDPENAGILIGGGEYAYGEAATVKATAVTGFTFVGWWDDDTNNWLGKQGDDMFTFFAGISGAHGTINLTAKFVGTVTKQLSVNCGQGTVTATYNNVTETWYGEQKRIYNIGTQFELTASAFEGFEFLYWLNKDNRIISTDPTYSFYLGDNTEIRPYFIVKTSDTPYVIVRDKNDKLLNYGNATKDGEIFTFTVPAHTEFSGFKFIGWFDADDNEYHVNGTTFTITESVTIYAKYELVEEAGTKYTVTANGGEPLSAEYEYGTPATVTAYEQVDGKYFSGWYDETDKLVSTERVYSFIVTGNIELTAKYEGETPISAAPVVVMRMGDRATLDNGKQTIIMDVSWDVPTGYTFIQGGVLRTLNSDYKDKLTLDDVDGTNVKSSVSTLTTAKGTYCYTQTLSVASVKKTVYAKGYIIFRNETTGEIVYLYTDLATSNPTNTAN